VKGSALPYWLTLIVVLATAYGVWRTGAGRSDRDGPSSAADRNPTVADAPGLENFTLTDQTGKLFDSRALDGQVWVANFFFTTCPSTCLAQNRRLAELQHDPDLADVQFVSISCDPDTDTPEVLADYAARFQADPSRWRFCTGPLDYIQRIGRDMMGLAVRHNTHSERAIVFDRSGKVRGRFLVTDTFASNQRDMLRTVLAECVKEPVPTQPRDDVTAEASQSPPGSESEVGVPN